MTALQLGIVFALMSGLGWGVGDFLLALFSRKYSNVAASLLFNPFALVTVALFILFSGEPLRITLPAAVFSFLTGVFFIIGQLSFFHGFIVGKIALVSPIAGGSSVIPVAGALILFGEKLAPLQVLAISIIIIGTMAASTDVKELMRSRRIFLSDPGVPYALIAFVTWGVGFIFFNQALKSVGWVGPNLIMFSTAIMLTWLYAQVKKIKIETPTSPRWWLVIIAAGVLLGASLISYSRGVETSLTSVVVAVSSAFPVVTVLLSRIFLKERLSPTQAVGISSIIAGLVLLNL